MLLTPDGPPGSSSSTAAERPDLGEATVPEQTAAKAAQLRHEIALLRARQEPDEARTAAATSLRGGATGAPTDSLTLGEGAGTIGSWLAHHQLGAAVDAVGAQVARTLGVVSRAERAEMASAVTDALTKAAEEKLDRTAAATLSGVPRSALERACMEALDRQAQLSIDEARRRNSLETVTTSGATEDSDPDPTRPHRREQPPAPRVRVLVTHDPAVAGGQWGAHHIATQLAAHHSALTRLQTQVETAVQDLETTFDCWIRGTSSTTWGDHLGAHAPGEEWRAQAGIADAAAAIAGGVRVLADAAQGTVGVGVGAASLSPIALGLELLAIARTDITLTNRQVSAGTHELLVRGAAALAGNLGQAGTVVADGVTTLNPSTSPLLVQATNLLAQRAELASATAALAGTVAFARSVTGLGAGPTVGSPSGHQGSTAERSDQRATSPSTRAEIEPGLREVTRQALLHERLVTHVVDSLGTLDRDLASWTQSPQSGGAPPLLMAIERERLHTGSERFTHVLVLQNEGMTADVVSRHSIVGASGRLTHIGAAAVGWLLIDVSTGGVIDGGQAAPARTLVQDLSSGRTSTRQLSPETTASLPPDPQRTLELAIKVSAVGAGLAVLIFAVIALVNILLG